MYTQAQIEAYMTHLNGMGKYTPEQIQKYRTHLETNFGPKAPGGSPENAVPQEIYGHGERVAAGFGNDAGNYDVLRRKGYTQPRKSPEGKTLVKDSTGRWVYEPDNFFPTNWEHPIDTAHPVNYLESGLGSVPPLAGMATGGMLGTASGGPAAGIVAAGLGNFTGKALQQRIGQALGTRPYQGPIDALEEASPAIIEGMATEAGGKLINQIPIGRIAPKYFHDRTVGEVMDTSLNYVSDKLRRAAATMSSAATLGKVPVDSAERMIVRPTEVMSMSERNKPGQPNTVVQGIADQAEIELEQNLKRVGRDQGQAKELFMRNNGRKMVDTTPAMRRHYDIVNRSTVNEHGTGVIEPQVMDGLEMEARRELQAKEMRPGPGAGELVHKNVYGPEAPFELPPGPMLPGGSAPELMGHEATVNRKTFEQLAPYRESLGARVGNWNANPLNRNSSPAVNNYEKGMYGAVTDLFHEVDPSLASADTAYNAARDDAALLRRLKTPGQGEGFIGNLMGRNKTEAQDAARRMTPKTFNGPVQDLQAARDFSEGAVMPGTGPAMARAGRALGAAMLGYGARANEASWGESLAIAGGLGLATSPLTQKYLLHYGARAIDPLSRSMRNYGGGQIMPMMLQQSPWEDLYK